jgi:bacillithiol system protein YtxJ
MTWHPLQNIEQLEAIDVESKNTFVLIYKHSTRCGICSSVKEDLEEGLKSLDDNLMKVYYLDLLQFRNVSNEIAKRYGVRHESPQILLIRNAKCIYSESQFSISVEKILAKIRQVN